jgi:hypothetical protein
MLSVVTLTVFAPLRWITGLYHKSFKIIIYDRNDSTIEIYNCNDSGLYYKTTIVTNLALARIVNYDNKIVRNATNCGLNYKSFAIIIYDRNDSSIYYKTMFVAI